MYSLELFEYNVFFFDTIREKNIWLMGFGDFCFRENYHSGKRTVQHHTHLVRSISFCVIARTVECP